MFRSSLPRERGPGMYDQRTMERRQCEVYERFSLLTADSRSTGGSQTSTPGWSWPLCWSPRAWSTPSPSPTRTKVRLARLTPRPDGWRFAACSGPPNINCQGVNSTDVTTTKDLEDLVSGDRSRGIDILFAHMKRQIREPQQRAGWDAKYEGVASYPATRDALQALGLLEEPHTSHHNLESG